MARYKNRYKPGPYVVREDLAREVQDVLQFKIGRDFRISPAYKLVGVIFDVIAKALQNGEEVKISGFGTFKIRETPARKRGFLCDNGGKPIVIGTKKYPRKKRVVFVPALPLKREYLTDE